MKVAVIIPNLDGKELLSFILPHLYKAIEYDKENDYEVIVVDDGSKDESVSFLNTYYPEIKVLENKKQKGFIHSINKGAKSTYADILITLNNDMYPEEDALFHLLKHFKKNTPFAVTPKIYAWDKKCFLYGNRGGRFYKGHLWLYEKGEDDVKSQTFFACGGGAAWERRRFLQLGGFDTLYSPFYYEEIDISYRALKRGWNIVYEPASIFYHKVQATMEKVYSKTHIKYISARNNYLFTWKNITEPRLFLQHLFFAPLFLLRDMLLLRKRFIVAFMMALFRLPLLLKRRAQEKKECMILDSKVFEKIKKI